MEDRLSIGHPLTSQPRSLWDKISGTSRMERVKYDPSRGLKFDQPIKKKPKNGVDMLKDALEKLSGSSTFVNPNAGKFPKMKVKTPTYTAPKRKPFKPVGPTSNGIGVGP